MGAGASNDAQKKNSNYKVFQEHPLLNVIENPINRFCDDFASSLQNDSSQKTQKTDNQMNQTEQEEIPGYMITKVLGNGAEAIVYQALKSGTPNPVALKHYKSINNKAQSGIPYEYEIAQLLDHPHCLKMFDCFQLQNGEYVISMPIGTHGCLEGTDVPVLTIPEGLLMLSQLGSALAHMHSRNVVHCDIKPTNILLFDDGYKFCDYSVSFHLNSADQQISGVRGTSIFMAAEISVNYYSPKPVDVWALGITVYSLLFGCLPYHLEKALEENGGKKWENTGLITKYVNLYELTFPDVPLIPDQMKQILSGMLAKDPVQRITAQEIADNAWVNQKCQEWKGIIDYMKGEIQNLPEHIQSFD